MVLVTDKNIYLNKILKGDLDVGLYAVKNKNQDLLIVIDGAEGSGKSQTARQIGYYCAHVLGTKFDTETSKNIHFDLNDYMKTSMEGEKGRILILDESRKILNKKRSMGKEAVAFTNFLSECRSRNQVHIIVLPAYHDLDSNIALWRLSMVIHMQKEWIQDEKIELGGHELRLGGFRAFANNEKLKMCYQWKGYRYPNEYLCRDRFKHAEVLSDRGMINYEEKKQFFIKLKYAEDKPQKDTHEECKRVIEAFKKNNFPILNMTLIGQIVGLHPDTVSNILEEVSYDKKKFRIDY